MVINNKTALGEVIAKAMTMKGIPKQKHISHTSHVLDDLDPPSPNSFCILS